MKLVKLSLFIFFLFLFQTQFLLCQGKFHPEKISESTNEYVNKIAKSDYISYCETCDNDFEELCDAASNEELLELTNHPKGIVRCAAFFAIVKNKSYDIISIILDHLHDYEEVGIMMSGMGWSSIVGDVFINRAKEDSFDYITKIQHDSAKFAQLDSIIIYSDSQLGSKIAILEDAAPTGKFYTRIREMVQTKTCDAALIALAKYKNNEDIPLIIDYLKDTAARYPRYYLYKAIQIFPHESFLPYLENDIKDFQKNCNSYNFRSTNESNLFLAISLYKNAQSAEMFNRTFNQFDNSRLKATYKRMIYDVLSQNRCALYCPFLWKLWEEEILINKEVFLDLYKDDSIKALKLAKANLIEFKKISRACPELSFNKKDSLLFELLSSMVDVMMKSDYSFTINAINQHIERSNWDLCSLFIKTASIFKDTAIVQSLFKRLENESNADNCLTIAKVLISYHDNAINQRIFKTMKNEKLFRNEKARDMIEDLLDENNIEEE